MILWKCGTQSGAQTGTLSLKNLGRADQLIEEKNGQGIT
jgi:hypothetical protein